METRSTAFLFEHHVLPAIRDSISEFSSFLEATERFLQDVYTEKLQAFIDEENRLGVKELPDGTSLVDFFKQHYDAWPEGRFARLLRESFVVSLYAFTEFSLIDLCRCLQRRDVRVSVGDMKGQNCIDKAKDYIGKVLCTEFPTSSQEWQEIQTYRRIRNCIVHNAGEVADSGDRKAIEQYVDHSRGRLLLAGDKILVERGFCSKMLETIRSFFDLVGRSLLKYITDKEHSLEPLQREFGEFYIGRPLRVMYVPPPPSTRRKNRALPGALQ